MSSLKAKFEAQNGLCYYCKQPTVMPPKLKKREPFIQPDNLATKEHLYPVGHILRDLGHQRIVMACRKCNQERNKEFHNIIKGNI